MDLKKWGKYNKKIRNVIPLFEGLISNYRGQESFWDVLLTVVIAENEDLESVAQKLEEEKINSEAIPSKRRRNARLESIKFVKDKLQTVPQKGIIYLCGQLYRVPQEKLVREEVHPPYPIGPEDSILVFDKVLHVGVLKKLMSDPRKIGIINLNSREITLSILSGSQANKVAGFEVKFVDNKLTKSVQDSRQLDAYISRAADMANESLLNSVDGLVVAHTYHYADGLARTNLLSEGLQQKLLKIINTEGMNYDSNTVIEKTSELFPHIRYIKEQELINELIEAVQSDRCFCGLDDTLHYLNHQETIVVIVMEGLAIKSYTLMHPVTGEKKVIHLIPEEEEESSNFFDGITKLDVLRVESFTTWIQNNRGVNTRIEVVDGNSFNVTRFADMLGGLAGITSSSEQGMSLLLDFRELWNM